jgi:hypothetical protein
MKMMSAIVMAVILWIAVFCSVQGLTAVVVDSSEILTIEGMAI